MYVSVFSALVLSLTLLLPLLLLWNNYEDKNTGEQVYFYRI